MSIQQYYKSKQGKGPAPFGLGDLIGTIKMGADVVTGNAPAVAMDAVKGAARWSGVGTGVVTDINSALNKFNLWQAQATRISPQGSDLPGLMPALNPFGSQ